MRKPRIHVAGLLVPVLLGLAAGCAGRRPPVLLPADGAATRTPVVVVTGVTGSVLRHRDTGRVVWGNGRSIFLPRDGGYAIALPLDGRNRLEAVAPVMQIRVAWLVQQAYGGVARLMEANGYRRGDLRDPQPHEDYFFFDYDWREESVASAAKLQRALERVRVARGAQTQRVQLICQSNAALICRYLAKYGDAPLELAAGAASGDRGGIEVDKMILVGSANGGSMRILRELHRGRIYMPWLGRRWRPEVLFTFPSLYEGLPVYRKDLFFDAQGEALDVDLFDAAVWERRQWSIFSPEAQRRVRRSGRTDLFGDGLPRQREFLAARLDRAARLHARLLADPPGFDPPRYYLIQDGFLSTPERALLSDDNGRPRTRFDDSRTVRRTPRLRALASDPGDGHATLGSQTFLSPAERDALAVPPEYFEGGHFGVILNPAAQRRILEILAE